MKRLLALGMATLLLAGTAFSYPRTVMFEEFTNYS